MQSNYNVTVKRRNARFFGRGELPFALFLAVFVARLEYFASLPMIVKALVIIAMPVWCFAWARADADASYRFAPTRQALIYGVAIYLGATSLTQFGEGLVLFILLVYLISFVVIAGAAGHLAGRISHHVAGDSLPGYLSSVVPGMATVLGYAHISGGLDQWTMATMLIQLLMGGVLYAGYRWSVRRSVA